MITAAKALCKFGQAVDFQLISPTIKFIQLMVANKVADTFEEAIDLCLEAIEKQLEKKKVRNNPAITSP